MAQDDLTQALDLLETGKFRDGPENQAAHAICQRHEGTAAFDWVHALVHRIEGDNANADYWYRRAGKARHPGAIEEEWAIVRGELL